MCIRRETREKARSSLAFSPVSKPHTHITYMLRQCTSIVYMIFFLVRINIMRKKYTFTWAHSGRKRDIYAHKRTHTYSHIYEEGGDEREHIHISGDSSPICKRHLESMLKGIKSYLCLVQTGHVDIEEFRCGRKGERHTNM